MNEQLKKKFEYLGTGTTKEYLVAALSHVKNEVADVRTKLNVKSEIENAVRLGIIQVIDELIINRLRQNPVSEEKEDFS